MCGIVGIAPLSPAETPDRERLARMIEAVKHRGPDGFGFYTAPGIGLAHARLSIIDLVSGDQPIRNETGSVQVIFNGEIFNYIELRARLESKGHRFYTQSDTEVIVHSYEEFGLAFANELNGQFAIALWDGEQQRLVLVRDRVGIRPLLYAQTPRGLLFASEAKSLFASKWIDAEIDPLGLAETCTFWSCVAPRTPFVGVSALPPGHIAVYERGRLSTQQYWDWDFARDDAHSDDLPSSIEQVRELFIDSVRLQLRADVPVGTYLSGGLDSSAVTAAVRKFSDTSLKSFSIAFEGAEFDERAYQEAVSRHLHTDHVTRTVTTADIGAAFPRAIRHIESPLVRTAGVPLMLLADRVREAGFKVVLTGEGADEVFGGYDLFKEAKIRRFWSKQPNSKWRGSLLRRLYGYLANSPTNHGMAAAFFKPDADVGDPHFAHRPRWNTTNRILRLLHPEFRQRIDAAHPIGQLAALAPRASSTWEPLARDQYVEAHTLLSGYLLHAQGDRVAMAASIEGRYPFLDHRLIELANRLPARFKIRGLTEKYILRRAVGEWLPPQVANRTKQPYRAPDSDSFFHNGQPLDYVAELLSPRAVAAAGYFDAPQVTRLLEKCRRGAALGFGDNMAFVTAISTQLLHAQFVNGQNVEPSLRKHA